MSNVYVTVGDALDATMPRVHRIAEEHGFHATRDDHTPEGFAASIALMHEELSDALKAFREGRPTDRHLPQHERITVKFADAIIRMMDTAQTLGLPLGDALDRKIMVNDGRPYMHGKAI